MTRLERRHCRRDAGTRQFAPSSIAAPSTLVAVKVEVEDVPVRPPGFKKRYGMASGKKAMPASSVALKNKGIHSSLAAGPSSSPAVRSAAVKLAELTERLLDIHWTLDDIKELLNNQAMDTQELKKMLAEKEEKGLAKEMVDTMDAHVLDAHELKKMLAKKEEKRAIYIYGDELHSGFVQAPQKFYGGLKDDPLGNQMQVIYEKVGLGVAGLQGIFYGGTGCFHRRKVIYGVPPDYTTTIGIKDSPSYKELQKKFGSSKELIESPRSIISGDMFKAPMVVADDLTSRVEVAKQVSACTYEAGTRWGQEVGWVYGAMTEDILTGQRIHGAGWRTALLDPDPPAFLGGAPTGGPGSLTQYKRWATGVLEILLSRHNPFLLAAFKHLDFRQCVAYLVIDVWAIRAPFELCYALLGPYCIIANHSFLPKASEPGFVIPLAMFLAYNAYNLGEYTDCRLSVRAWWNNHRMQQIVSSSAWLLAVLTVVLKTLGLSETVFEVTRKEQSDGGADDDADPGRFTFDSSPVFVPPTELTMLSIINL
ncbi:cellulose synthase-like protein H2 [Miscanthus floridulus]|uniref:cellulose synthase-like protein H2 n=1 Tax=Miscanthus floridulus TaxID=154761 RepID=UPI003457B911